MKHFRFFAVILLCLSLFSCSSAKNNSTDAILAEIMEECGELPSGKIYRGGREDTGESGISDALMSALYGEDAKESFMLVEQYSIYLSSFASPYEIAVFKCYSSTDAKKLEELCRARADIVSVALRNTDYYELCDDIMIVREGRLVAFAMTDSEKVTERSVRKLL